MRSLMVVVGTVAALMSATAGNVHGQGNPQAAESFVLSGVISFDGGGGLAWLQEPTLTNNQVVAVRRGDRVGPYRLTEIFEDRVELEGPAGKLFIPLYSAQGAAPSQTAAAPAPLPSAVATSLQQLLNQARQQHPPAQTEPPTPQVRPPRMPATSVPKAYANNPDALYVPMGDPRRTQGLGALLELGKSK